MSHRSLCQKAVGNVVVEPQADTRTPVLDFLVTALLEWGQFRHLCVSPSPSPAPNCRFLPGLTFGDLDVQSRPDQSHQGGGEVHCHVLSDGHIHQDQPLWVGERNSRGKTYQKKPW